MKKLLVVIAGLILGFSALSQQLFFVAIDADQQQPFAVLISKKAYSSNSQGHLILSSLKDSTYDITVSFPRNSYPDQHFRLEIRKKDRGFQLKKTGEKTWGLYDWQSMELLQPMAPVSYASFSDTKETRNDAFAIMMAAVVNDTAVLIKNTTKPMVKISPEKKPVSKDTAQKVVAPMAKAATTGIPSKTVTPPVIDPPVVITPSKDTTETVKIDSRKVDSALLVKEKERAPKDTLSSKEGAALVKPPVTDTAVSVVQVPPPTPVLKNEIEDAVKLPPAPVPAVIRKVFDNTGKETRAILFRDSSSAGIDTISVKIDLESVVAEKEPAKQGQVSNTEKSADLIEKRQDLVATGKVIPAPVITNTVDSAKTKANSSEGPGKDTVVQSPVTVRKDTAATVKKLTMVNSDCLNKATDADVDKLRVKMLAATTTDDRVVVARKVFKTKCFTTRQIKALSELFLSDESRYQFFDAAYPFVLDTDEFKSLVNLLTEEYYINRFKAMVRF